MARQEALFCQPLVAQVPMRHLRVEGWYRHWRLFRGSRSRYLACQVCRGAAAAAHAARAAPAGASEAMEVHSSAATAANDAMLAAAQSCCEGNAVAQLSAHGNTQQLWAVTGALRLNVSHLASTAARLRPRACSGEEQPPQPLLAHARGHGSCRGG